MSFQARVMDMLAHLKLGMETLATGTETHN